MPIDNCRINNEQEAPFLIKCEVPFFFRGLTDEEMQKAIVLPVKKLSISDDELNRDAEKEHITTLSSYYVEEDNFVYYMPQRSHKRRYEESELGINSDVIINQDLDQILAEYEFFKYNTVNAKSLQKLVAICFDNGINALLSLGFIKDEENDVSILMYYGWKICHRETPDKDSLNKCYTYLNKRFKTTLLHLLNVKSLRGLEIEMAPFQDDAVSIFSDPKYDDDNSIGNPGLYKIYLFKPKS